MVTTIESLPNEVLEMIFSILGGLPKLPLREWAMLDDHNDFSNRNDVLNLSCSSKRLYKAGRSERQVASCVGYKESAQFLANIMDTVDFKSVKQLYIEFDGDHSGVINAQLLGQRLHQLPHLEYLFTRFYLPNEGAYDCDSAECQFMMAIMVNPALDDYQLLAFRYVSGNCCECGKLWQAIARLQVSDLMLNELFAVIRGEASCPSLRRLALEQTSRFGDSPFGDFYWQALCNLEEVWLWVSGKDELEYIDSQELWPGQRELVNWRGLPPTVHTIGIGFGSRLSILAALKQAALVNVRRIVIGMPVELQNNEFYDCVWDEAGKRNISKIRALMEERGGKVETFTWQWEEAEQQYDR